MCWLNSISIPMIRINFFRDFQILWHQQSPCFLLLTGLSTYLSSNLPPHCWHYVMANLHNRMVSWHPIRLISYQFASLLDIAWLGLTNGRIWDMHSSLVCSLLFMCHLCNKQHRSHWLQLKHITIESFQSKGQILFEDANLVRRSLCQVVEKKFLTSHIQTMGWEISLNLTNSWKENIT